VAQRRTQWRKARSHRHKEQIGAPVIFDGEATTDYFFQYDMVVAPWFEERSCNIRRRRVVFDQELEFILFRRGCKGDIRISDAARFQYRDLAGFESGARTTLWDHEKAPDRLCMFVDASNA
jgi:hypothetical protein